MWKKEGKWAKSPISISPSSLPSSPLVPPPVRFGSILFLSFPPLQHMRHFYTISFSSAGIRFQPPPPATFRFKVNTRFFLANRKRGERIEKGKEISLPHHPGLFVSGVEPAKRHDNLQMFTPSFSFFQAHGVFVFYKRCGKRDKMAINRKAVLEVSVTNGALRYDTVVWT